jgi:hypothetical protein
VKRETFFAMSALSAAEMVEHFVIGSGGGVAGKIEDVGHVVAWRERDGAEIENRGDEVDAVEIHSVVLLEIIAERGGAEGAVAFADKEFGRVPTAVAADVGGDELGERFDILVDAPEIFIFGLANGAAEAGSDGIDKDEIGFVEQAIGIVDEFEGRRRRGAGVSGDDAARPEGSHVQPDGRRSGAAVVDEGDGTLAHILDVAAGIGNGENAGGRFAFVVLDEGSGSGGLVGDGLGSDLDGVVGDGGLFFGLGGRLGVRFGFFICLLGLLRFLRCEWFGLTEN